MGCGHNLPADELNMFYLKAIAVSNSDLLSDYLAVAFGRQALEAHEAGCRVYNVFICCFYHIFFTGEISGHLFEKS
jgi:hypothetical protein